MVQNNFGPIERQGIKGQKISEAIFFFGFNLSKNQQQKNIFSALASKMGQIKIKAIFMYQIAPNLFFFIWPISEARAETMTIISLGFFEELKARKNTSEISWPLAIYSLVFVHLFPSWLFYAEIEYTMDIDLPKRPKGC